MVLRDKILDVSSTEVSRSSQDTRSQYNGSALHLLYELSSLERVKLPWGIINAFSSVKKMGVRG